MQLASNSLIPGTLLSLQAEPGNGLEVLPRPRPDLLQGGPARRTSVRGQVAVPVQLRDDALGRVLLAGMALEAETVVQPVRRGRRAAAPDAGAQPGEQGIVVRPPVEVFVRR